MKLVKLVKLLKHFGGAEKLKNFKCFEKLKNLLVNSSLSLIEGVFILYVLYFLVILLEFSLDLFLTMSDNLGKKVLACRVKIPSRLYEKVRDHYENLLKHNELYLSNIFQF